MKKIGTEEAFVTPEVVAEWDKLLDDGAPAEPGFKLQIGYFHTVRRHINRNNQWSDLKEDLAHHV